jgi:DnaJ-domain-containing protein 1
MFGFAARRKTPQKGGKEDRRSPRALASEEFSTHLGDAVDISATGLQIKCRQKPPLRRGQALEITLRSGARQARIPARLVWVRRSRFETRCGFQFIGLSDGQRAVVESILHFGYIPSPEDIAEAKRRRQERTSLKLRAEVVVPDYYRALDVSPEATAEEVHHAYRVLARRWHPDVCSEPGAEQRFRQVNEAYAVLRSQRDRAAYDAVRRPGPMPAAG